MKWCMDGAAQKAKINPEIMIRQEENLLANLTKPRLK